MFGLSKKEILANAIMNASKNNLNIYKQGLKDNWEKVIDEESMQEIVMKIRKEYLNKVFEDIVAGLNVSAPSVASKLRFVANNSSVCGYDMDDTYGKMAGHVFAICYYAMTNKKADAEQCIKLNHMQDALMKEVLHELDSEMSQEEDDDGVGNERIEKIYNPISAYVNTIFAHFTGSSLKRKLIDREHNNIVVIYSYLLAILYAEWKDRKGTEDAEQMAKAMAYELLFNRMNLEEEQGEKLFDYMSNVITKTQSMKRLILSGKEFQNSTLEEQLAIYIVKDVLFYDKEYVTPDEENKNLIAQIKQDLVYFKNGMIKDFENETKEQTEESNENGEFSIQDMGLGIHKLIATELIRVETVLKKKNLTYERSDFFTSTFAYYYGMWMAFVKRKTTQEQYSKLYELMNNLFMSFNEITYKDNLELISYNKIKFEKRFKEAIENISEGITQNGMFIDCGITDKYLKNFISEKDIGLIKGEIVEIVLSKWARPVIVVLKEKKIVD